MYRGNKMISEINSFTAYLQEVKHTAKNTEVSYHRDLLQMAGFMEEMGITQVEKVTKTSLNSYILYLEKEGKAAATISRELASIKAFFSYLVKERKINRDPAEFLRAPKIERKIPVILTIEEIHALLAQPGNTTAKELRDKAMLELLYATGIRVSELISLKLEDVNMQIGYITCHDGSKDRMIPFGKGAKQALRTYLDKARSSLLKGRACEWLFTNCSGQPMSRQGFWKLIKYYGGKNGDQRGYYASYSAPFFCSPPDRGWRGYPCSPGYVRTWGYRRFPDVCCVCGSYSCPVR